jgi:PAS domain-containing protein
LKRRDVRARTVSNPGAFTIDTEMQGCETATAFIEMDEQGRYLDADPQALATFGVSLEELRQHCVGDFSGTGLGHVHRALFRWLTRQGQDFGGGESTIVSPDGTRTRIHCTSVSRVGDGRFRLEFTPLSGSAVPPHSSDLQKVLEAWREAERDAAAADSDGDRELAGQVTASLRDIYQWVSERKT